MNVLLVDDDPDFLEGLSPVLERLGHTVQSARGAMEGWATFRARPFDVVLTDWSMPDINGPDLCRMIRGLRRDAYAYVVMLTANSGSDRIIEALDAGADDFLAKPVDRGVLAARLRVAERILRLHGHVTLLEGILSMCSYCKRIRRDDGSWLAVERYLQERSELRFSHGICESCVRALHPGEPCATRD